MEIKLQTKSNVETEHLGELIAKHVFPNLVITLTGDLGAGKTTLVKGLARGLGIKDKVTSPTFNILKCYFNKPISLFHIDAYRLADSNKDIGLEEFIEGNGVCVIEWPMYIKEMLPEVTLNININHAGDDNRDITIDYDGDELNELFTNIKEVK